MPALYTYNDIYMLCCVGKVRLPAMVVAMSVGLLVPWYAVEVRALEANRHFNRITPIWQRVDQTSEDVHHY